MITLDELTDVGIVSSAGNELLPNANGSIDVEATDLDIRDLVFATDSVDTSGSVVALDAATLAALEDITVSATDLDIRDLVFATDKVDVSGSTISTSPSLTTAIKTTAETVGVAAAEVVATPLASRRFITIQNEGSADVFFGPTGVTTATGMKISKKSSATYEFGPTVDIFMISGSAAQDVRILEVA